jgi:hypothetical protein
MHLKLFPLFFCAVFLAGCRFTSEIGYEQSQKPPEEVLESLRGTEAEISLKDSTVLEGEIVRFTSDSVFVQLTDPEYSRSIPIEAVDRIHVSGSALGPVLGSLGGGGTGFLIGYAVGGSGREREIGQFYGGVMIGALGMLAGGIAGAAITPANDYLAPPQGIAIRQPPDPDRAITIEVDRFLSESEDTITISWYDRQTVLPKSQITILKTGNIIAIRAPRSLLYDAHNSPIYRPGP